MPKTRKGLWLFLVLLVTVGFDLVGLAGCNRAPRPKEDTAMQQRRKDKSGD